jgi:hypothetical protein
MATTWELIASANGGSTIVDFNSIPQTFTDLVVYASIRGTNTGGGGDTNAPLNIRFNVSGLSYSTGAFYAENSATVFNAGTSGASQFAANVGYAGASSVATTFSNTYLYISNYTSTSYVKPIILQTGSIPIAGGPANGQWAGSFSDSGTAITNIRFFNTTNAFTSTSTFYLYGIKNTV